LNIYHRRAKSIPLGIETNIKIAFLDDKKISESCISPSKGVEGVLYGGKLFMKKKLFSILLSLSMCATYATPLATVAADNTAPAENITVVETAAPNVTNASQFSVETTSTGNSLQVEYDQKIKLRKIGAFAVKGTSSGAIGSGKIEDVDANLNGVTVKFSIPKAADENTIGLVDGADGNKCVYAKKSGKTATIKVSVTTGGNLVAEGNLKVSTTKKNIGIGSEAGNKYTTSGEATKVDFEEALGTNKKYANLDAVVKKFNGKKGLTFKVYNYKNSPVEVSNKEYTAKASISTEYTKKIEKQTGNGKVTVYVKSESGVSASTTSEGAIEDRVDITITGKKNFTGTFVVTGCKVKNLETKRIVADNTKSISGKAIIFGSDDEQYSLMKNLYLNDDDEIERSDNYASIYKFKASKNVKVNAKKGTVTVKKVDGSNDTANVATVTVTSKKNKNASVDLVFSVTAKSITGDEFVVDDTNAVKTAKGKDKYYKSLKAFTDKMTSKGKGLTISYTKKVNGNDKKIKLKGGDNKDFTIVTTNCGVELNTEDADDTGVFITSDGTIATTKVSNKIEYAINGKGNYIGTTTGTFEVPLYTQVVSGTSTISDTVITFGKAEKSIYDYITVDDNALNNSDNHITADQAKDLLKIKADSTNVKLDKEGKIVAKKIDGNKAKIKITSKKNSKGAAAVKTLEFELDAADIHDATVDTSALSPSSGQFANSSKAMAAINKIKVTFNGKTLKKTRDYTISTDDLSDNEGTNERTISGDIFIEGKGNYTGSKKVTVNISYKK
jgi:hypothetical protein